MGPLTVITLPAISDSPELGPFVFCIPIVHPFSSGLQPHPNLGIIGGQGRRKGVQNTGGLLRPRAHHGLSGRSHATASIPKKAVPEYPGQLSFQISTGFESGRKVLRTVPLS